MLTKQENFITMVHAVNGVLKNYQTKWQSVKRFAQSAQELSDLLNLTATVSANADSAISGATKDKHAIGFDVIDQGVKFAKRGSIYALDIKNMELHDKLRVSRSSLLNRHDAEALAKLKDIYMQLSPIVDKLADYGILSSDLKVYKKLIDEYDNLLTKPRELTASRKTMNTSLLPELINKMRTVLYQLDSLINLFDMTPFEEDYLNARKIIDLGTRKRKPQPSVPGEGTNGENNNNEVA